ncbi:MAG: FAD-dependent monooxygenase [Acidovorax sp.]
MALQQLLIAGGGIGGLAAGLAAVRAGWEVRLFERAAAFSEVGAGVQLGPNVVRVLQAWGLDEGLDLIAAYPERLSVRCARSGAQLAELPLGQRCVQRYGAPYATVHRADLHALLLAGLEWHQGAHLNPGCAIDDHEDTGSAVVVRTSGQKFVEGDMLLGADGLRSRTRAALLDDGPPHATGHLAYRALVPLPEPLHTGEVTAWLGPRLHVVSYPVRRGELLNLVAIVEGPASEDMDTWDHAANAADLDAALAGACAELQVLVRSAGDRPGGWRLWPLADRAPVARADQMARGRVALLGDAAHPMLPYLAQGAGMAIEDAAELGRALAMQDIDVPLRLQRYALNRWRRNAQVQERAQRNGRIFHATGPLRWGRDAGLRLLGQRLIDLPWLYGAST